MKSFEEWKKEDYSPHPKDTKERINSYYEIYKKNNDCFKTRKRRIKENVI